MKSFATSASAEGQSPGKFSKEKLNLYNLTCTTNLNYIVLAVVFFFVFLLSLPFFITKTKYTVTENTIQLPLMCLWLYTVHSSLHGIFMQINK